MGGRKKGSVPGAILWMFVLSLLLCWLPFFGPLVAGAVGGKKAGGVGAAIMAVLLPSVVFGLLLFLLATSLTGVPVIGGIAAAGRTVFALSQVGPLLLGAIIGGGILA